MADKKETKRGLGRGLSALMADVEAPVQKADVTSTTPKGVQTVPIEQIKPNPDQPRRHFDSEKLDELAQSIRSKGVLQPLIVRWLESEGHYEIVAGERRWRASQIAQLHEIPVIVREFSDIETVEIAIIENVQRADLNPIEEAAGYNDLLSRFGHTQENVAEALGKSRSHIANTLRLLTLPEGVQKLLLDGKLSAGHGRALITTDDPEALAKVVLAKGLNVRETEKLAKSGGAETRAKTTSAKNGSEKDADTRALEGDLSAALGMKVSVDHKDGTDGGKLSITYTTFEDLDALCMLLTKA